MRKKVLLTLVPTAGLLSLLWLSGSQSTALASSSTTYTLTVYFYGDWSGNFNGYPEDHDSIVDSDCSSDFSYCYVTLSRQQNVRLEAKLDPGYTIAGWGGDCSHCGTSTTCTIYLNANKTCSVTFTASGGGTGGGGSGGGTGGGGGGGGGSGPGSGNGSGTTTGYRLTVYYYGEVNGGWYIPYPEDSTSIVGRGCDSDSAGPYCYTTFSRPQNVTLVAVPNTGYIFAGWGGDCSRCGTSTICTIYLNANKTCSVIFTASGGGTGGGGTGGSGTGGGGGGGGTSVGGISVGGCSMTGSASSMAGLWNILAWLSVPLFALVRRIRKK
jgi:uncharacterized repeat protein (TIGR02543 family)